MGVNSVGTDIVDNINTNDVIGADITNANIVEESTIDIVNEAETNVDRDDSNTAKLDDTEIQELAENEPVRLTLPTKNPEPPTRKITEAGIPNSYTNSPKFEEEKEEGCRAHLSDASSDTVRETTLTCNDTERDSTDPMEVSFQLNASLCNIPSKVGINEKDFVKFVPSKRTKTSKLLDKENFRFDVYKSENQAGFQTHRPLMWLQALSEYSALGHISCRWESKLNKEKNKYAEYVLNVCFMDVKHTSINLKLATGVLTIKGLSYKLWIDNEFKLLQDIMKKLTHIPEEKTTTHQDTQTAQEESEEKVSASSDQVTPPALIPPAPPPPPPPLPPLPNSALRQSKAKPTKSKQETEGMKNDTNKDLELLWEENDKLKKAIVSLEEELKSKSSLQIGKIAALETTIDSLKGSLEKVEKSFDGKLEIFLDEIEKLFIQKTSNIRHEFTGKLNQIETKVTKNKAECENTDSSMNPKSPTETTDLQMQIDSLKADLINMDLSSFELEYVNNREKNVTNFKKVEKRLQEVDKLNEKVAKQLRNLENQIKENNKHPKPENSTVISRQQTTTQDTITRNSQPKPNQDTHRRNTSMDNRSELLMIWDSNCKHISYNKLWTMNKTKIVRCGNLYEIENHLNENSYSNLKHIFINVGVNDIDYSSGFSVFNMIIELLDKIQDLYPEVKVTLSEITPRTDRRDSEVIICNRLIQEYAETNTKLFVARHNNLRHPRGLFHKDSKHLKENIMGRFVSNIKRTLEKAYDIDSSYHKQHRKSNNYDEPYHYRNHYNSDHCETEDDNMFRLDEDESGGRFTSGFTSFQLV